MKVSQKDRILREAAGMFLDEGIKSVRMDDIATRLGVSKRTLYEMFGDKRDLLEQSLAVHFERKRRDLLDRTKNAVNVVEEIFLIMEITKHNEKDRVLICNLRKFYPDIYIRLQSELSRFNLGKYDMLLERGMKEGLLLPDMNKEMALLTLTHTMGALFEMKNHFETAHNIPSQVAFRYILVNFFRGLATQKGIEIIDELVIKYKYKGQTNE